MTRWMDGTMLYRDFPCLGCDERKLHCHSVCKRYLEASKRNDEIREARRKVMDAERIYDRRKGRRT